MKTAFNVKRTTHNAIELGNYSRFIVNSLSASFPGHTYQLYTPSKGKEVLWKRTEERPSVPLHYPEGRFDKLFPSLWRTSGLTTTLQEEHVDLFRGLSNEIPMNLKQNGIPTVVTTYDSVFLRYPQLYKLVDRSTYIYKFKQACLRSDKVAAISRQTTRDIWDFFRTLESKIGVVYRGCGPAFGRAVQEDVKSSVRKKYQISGPYILHVGSTEERENLLLLVRTLKKLKKDASVIVTGKHTPYMDTVETYTRENNLSGRVHILTHMPFNELAAFYQMVTLFVCPSFSKGFGIPILKAQLVGIPVIATIGSCLEEAGGPSTLHTDPRNEQELYDLVESVLNEPKLIESMHSGRQKNIRRFMSGVLTVHFM